MRKVFALGAAIGAVCCAAPVLAGVVITQTQTLQHGPMSRSSEQSVMVQGDKQKITDHQRVLIIDLDQLKQYILMPATKSYWEMPISMHGRMPRMSPTGRGVAGAGFDFKKTGKSRTVSGYKCDEYEASGQSMSGEYKTTQCFSKSAPGASDYAAFQKVMAEKMKTAAPDVKFNTPPGIPIASDSTIQRGHHGAGFEHGGTHTSSSKERPPTVIHTEVTKIEKQDLPASTFEVPSDYKKIQVGGAAAPGASATEEAPAAAPSAAGKPQDQ